MKDIGQDLSIMMSQKQCTPLYALLIMRGKKDVRVLQPQPTKETRRGLRDKGNR